MKEDVFVIVRYALAEPKKETGSFEERHFNFNFIAEKGLDNAIEDINNYILSKYYGIDTAESCLERQKCNTCYHNETEFSICQYCTGDDKYEER